MKIELSKRLSNYQDVVSWALLVAITAASNDHDNNIKPFLPDDNGEVEVKLLVNGIEVPFENVMDRFKTSYDENVSKKARELLMAKAGDIIGFMNELEESLKFKAKELFPLDYDEDER